MGKAKNRPSYIVWFKWTLAVLLSAGVSACGQKIEFGYKPLADSKSSLEPDRTPASQPDPTPVGEPDPEPIPDPTDPDPSDRLCTRSESAQTVVKNAQFCYLSPASGTIVTPLLLQRNSSGLWWLDWGAYQAVADSRSGLMHIENINTGAVSPSARAIHGNTYVGASTDLEGVNLHCYHMCSSVVD
ncbi:MAG: hypothetical protein AB7G93_17110 [Bdellovibrionales bacterium]